jgi:multiple sugar transport system ATP-binding protein
MASVTFDNVSKVFADGTRAVDRLELAIEDGEFMVLVGPSGSGKTTALRMVAGLDDISDGFVRIGERVVNHVPSRDRGIAMVFQSYALYPHLTVAENIAFGLRLRNVPKREIEARVHDVAGTLGLDDLLDRKPAKLSGGQRQRVAMGRAIVRNPAVFLMDEPLSNLDAKLRVQTRAGIAALQRRLGVTTVYVTHDQVEAMTMADRVAVMRGGRLQQVAPPRELYDRPVNVFVGGFIGSPAMNLIHARVARQRDGIVLEFGDNRLVVDAADLVGREALRAYDAREIVLGIRPEQLEHACLVADAPAGHRLRGRVELREALGSDLLVHFSLAGVTPVASDDEHEREPGAELLRVGDGEALVGRFGSHADVVEGAAVEVAVDTGGLHFFDAETGLGIYDRTR